MFQEPILSFFNYGNLLKIDLAVLLHLGSDGCDQLFMSFSAAASLTQRQTTAIAFSTSEALG